MRLFVRFICTKTETWISLGCNSTGVQSGNLPGVFINIDSFNPAFIDHSDPGFKEHCSTDIFKDKRLFVAGFVWCGY